MACILFKSRPSLPTQFNLVIDKDKTRTQLEEDYMDLTNREFQNEQELDDFIV